MALHAPFYFFFFNDTATTEIYTLSLHDALPILCWGAAFPIAVGMLKKEDLSRGVGLLYAANTLGAIAGATAAAIVLVPWIDRKSTRLNSSHVRISHAVFCVEKKHQTDVDV